MGFHMFYWHKKHPVYNPLCGKEKALKMKLENIYHLRLQHPVSTSKIKNLKSNAGRKMTRTPEMYSPPPKDWPGKLVKRQLSYSLASSFKHIITGSVCSLYRCSVPRFPPNISSTTGRCFASLVAVYSSIHFSALRFSIPS